VKDTPLKAALALKEKYKKKIDLQIGFQTLFGILDKKERRIYEKNLEHADYISGLPSADRPNFNKSLNVFCDLAKQTGKSLALHIDQEFNPKEKDSLKFAKAVIKKGLFNKTTIIHGVSIAAQTPKTRKEIYKHLKAGQISIVVCPGAALSMKMLNQKAYLSNSIAPVRELIENGINVGLGTDNIHDFFMPLAQGDMWFELKMLAEACRYYDISKLAEIASKNGLKILNSNN
ncbi:MAG: amidohydrolase family protein, partial [Candidatus Moranbacteria bacterium]|nr:amidohydrolase family protein [Candidatus Moranbacteria bacterium]